MTEANVLRCSKCGKPCRNGGALQTHQRGCGRKLLDPDWFWPKVKRGEPVECWVWTGAVSSWGYGTITFKGKGIGAHKLAWMLANGEVPAGLQVLHRCDNRVCCNPGHLFLGTIQDNAADKVRKGRQVRGEKQHGAKLTEAQVREILRNPPKLGHGGNVLEYVKKYGVGRLAIYGIVSRRYWKHVTIEGETA